MCRQCTRIAPIGRRASARAWGNWPNGRRESRQEGRLIWRTDVVPGMEAIAATLPPGQSVVFSCYRLFSPSAAGQIEAMRAAWEAARASLTQAGQPT